MMLDPPTFHPTGHFYIQILQVVIAPIIRPITHLPLQMQESMGLSRLTDDLHHLLSWADLQVLVGLRHVTIVFGREGDVSSDRNSQAIIYTISHDGLQYASFFDLLSASEDAFSFVGSKYCSQQWSRPTQIGFATTPASQIPLNEFLRRRQYDHIELEC